MGGIILANYCGQYSQNPLLKGAIHFSGLHDAVPGLIHVFLVIDVGGCFSLKCCCWVCWSGGCHGFCSLLGIHWLQAFNMNFKYSEDTWQARKMMLSRGQFSCRRCRHAVGGHHRHCRHSGHASCIIIESIIIIIIIIIICSSATINITWKTLSQAYLAYNLKWSIVSAAPVEEAHQGGTEKRVSTMLTCCVFQHGNELKLPTLRMPCWRTLAQ